MKKKEYIEPILEITRFDIEKNIMNSPTNPGDVTVEYLSHVEVTTAEDIGFGDW